MHRRFRSLQKIKQIGPVLAERIVRAGPFQDSNEVSNVRGIGRVRVEELEKQFWQAAAVEADGRRAWVEEERLRRRRAAGESLWRGSAYERRVRAKAEEILTRLWAQT